jgi:putative hydrolase of the HAD superfamily
MRSEPAEKGPIAAVLFDAVGTLVYPEPSVADVYSSIARRYGSALSADEIRPRFRQAIASDSPDDNLPSAPTSEALERERWRRIVAAVITDVPPSEFEPLFAELWRHFAEPSSWRLFDDVAPCWSQLQQRGIVVGIASNFDSRLRSVAAGLWPMSHCDHWFISSEIGYPKPDQRFFRAVEDRLGLQPSQILLVGDDRVNDIIGGQSAGWQTAWIDRSGNFAEEPTLGSLAELPALLEQTH